MMSSSASTKLIRVGHSPDPDDAFMFYALAHEKINMRGFRVEHVIEDIESLNQRAFKAELEVTAVSCHAYAYLSDKYIIKRCGASVGDGYGPVLIKRRNGEWGMGNSEEGRRSNCKLKRSSFTHSEQREEYQNSALRTPNSEFKRIAVPGKWTTAYLALQIYTATKSAKSVTVTNSDSHQKGQSWVGFEPVFIPFDKIFDAVQSGDCDLGLVIHEGQLTHAKLGFEKVLDLGEWWRNEYQVPMPLGIDVIRRDLGRETIESFTQLFKESIEYALAHREQALEYALQFGRGIQKDLGDQFVGMYVNHYTVDLGSKGEAGLRKLYEIGYQKGILPRLVTPEFV